MNAASSVDLSPTLSALDNLHEAPHRLLLLVGPAGSGKTRHLLALKAARGYPRVALGAPVTGALQAIAPKRRPGRVRTIVTDVLEKAERAEAVLIDNIEVLFLPELSTDPLALFQELSRNRTLVVAWPGVVEEDGTLRYAELGHPEHRTFRNHRIHCIRMPGTA